MEAKKQSQSANKIHHVLAHSYAVSFILFLTGFCLDITFKVDIFTNPLLVPLGSIILILGSCLILWAQRTSRTMKKDNINKTTFLKGPYRYSRSPTHFGLFLLIVGFGLMINAPFVIISTCISFIISKFFFLAEEEKVLEKKYGSHYTEYKKSVHI